MSEKVINYCVLYLEGPLLKVVGSFVKGCSVLHKICVIVFYYASQC